VVRERWTDERILAALEAGEPILGEHVHRITGVSRATIKRWIIAGKTSDDQQWRHVRQGKTRKVVAEDVLTYLAESKKVRTGTGEDE
jgi:hypothetical protein